MGISNTKRAAGFQCYGEGIQRFGQVCRETWSPCKCLLSVCGEALLLGSGRVSVSRKTHKVFGGPDLLAMGDAATA